MVDADIGDDEEVRVGVRYLVERIDFDQRVRYAMPQHRYCRTRRTYCREEGAQLVAASVFSVADDAQDAIGREASDHLVVTAAVAGMVVTRDRVAHALA